MSARERVEPLYPVLPASPAERRRLASCDSGAAEAISIGRYNEWANRRESIGFCNQRPESSVWPAYAQALQEADGTVAIRAVWGLQDTPHNLHPSSDRISACP